VELLGNRVPLCVAVALGYGEKGRRTLGRIN
jgi:hypothetical protein